MASGDVFALKNTGLDAFLFAAVGNEMNGFPLTVISILARIGKDPWAQAAEWASMPDAATADCLASIIGQTPLCPRAHADARVTAERLVMLLPGRTAVATQSASQAVNGVRTPKWLPMAIIGAVFAAVVVAGLYATAPVAHAPAERSTGSRR